jgi:hypothetical protein
MDLQPTSSIAPALHTNVTFNNMFEFLIMRQKLSVAQEIYRTSVVAMGMCLNWMFRPVGGEFLPTVALPSPRFLGGHFPVRVSLSGPGRHGDVHHPQP